jgi:pyruvate carboxylase subunit A
MKQKLFKKVLVANRGEIAVRVMRACRELGIETAAIYSDADRDALHARYADEAHHIGPAAPTESYLQLEKIVKLAGDVGAQAIHPGYGFLSERPEFPEACAAAGLAFIGPPAEAMRAMGSKLEARALAESHGVPVTPGSPALDDPEAAAEAARKIGFPVIVKPSGGGGGIGMKVVDRESELAAAIESCRNAARSAFGDPTVYVEKYVRDPRHTWASASARSSGGIRRSWRRRPPRPSHRRSGSGWARRQYGR